MNRRAQALSFAAVWLVVSVFGVFIYTDNVLLSVCNWFGGAMCGLWYGTAMAEQRHAPSPRPGGGGE